MKLVEVSSAKKSSLPIAKNTAYKWHSLKKYPRLIYKVGGKLFFDLDEWGIMAEKARTMQVKEASRIYRKA